MYSWPLKTKQSLSEMERYANLEEEFRRGEGLEVGWGVVGGIVIFCYFPLILYS